jgi:hypothetical protein
MSAAARRRFWEIVCAVLRDAGRLVGGGATGIANPENPKRRA